MTNKDVLNVIFTLLRDKELINNNDISNAILKNIMINTLEQKNEIEKQFNIKLNN